MFSHETFRIIFRVFILCELAFEGLVLKMVVFEEENIQTLSNYKLVHKIPLKIY